MCLMYQLTLHGVQQSFGSVSLGEDMEGERDWKHSLQYTLHLYPKTFFRGPVLATVTDHSWSHMSQRWLNFPPDLSN